MKPTQGRLKIRRIPGSLFAIGTDIDDVLRLRGGMAPTDLDAQRLVDCWNACEGIENPEHKLRRARMLLEWAANEVYNDAHAAREIDPAMSARLLETEKVLREVLAALEVKS